jgi:hypothetical protein
MDLEFEEASEMILRRVGILSLGKFMGCLSGLMGLLIGAVVSLVALLGGFAAQNQEPPVRFWFLAMGVASIIGFPLLYGFLGFVGGVIYGAIFNMVASLVGGIEIELIRGDEKPIQPLHEPFSEDPFRG